MKTFLTSAVLCSAVLFFTLTSASSFYAPKQFGQRLGFTIAGADGINEVRAQYGGFFLAMAVINVLALMGVIPRGTGLLLTSAVFGGLITGRIASLILDGGFASYGSPIRQLFLIDGTGFTLSIIAYLRERSLG
jgi:hypothetical protein